MTSGNKLVRSESNTVPLLFNKAIKMTQRPQIKGVLVVMVQVVVVEAEAQAAVAEVGAVDTHTHNRQRHLTTKTSIVIMINPKMPPIHYYHR